MSENAIDKFLHGEMIALDGAHVHTNLNPNKLLDLLVELEQVKRECARLRAENAALLRQQIAGLNSLASHLETP